MKKSTALALFGNDMRFLAAQLDCTVRAIQLWPDDPAHLPRQVADRVIAAKVRHNVELARSEAHAEQREYTIDPLEADALALE